MFTADRPRVAPRRRAFRRWAPVALIAVLAAGCGSAGATGSTAAKPGAASTAAGGAADMSGMDMGPHYGNDVTLPGAGTYKLTLLVSPPVSARHLEYRGVWLKPHKVTFTFHWRPAS